MASTMSAEAVATHTVGQTVFHVLNLDQNLQPKLFNAALDRVLPDTTRFWAAAILLGLAGQSAPDVLDNLFESDRARGNEEGLFSLSHRLEEVEHFEYLIQSIAEFGYVSLF